MYTTIELIEMVRKKNDGCTDYKLHKILGCHQTTISNYVKGVHCLSDEMAMKVASELGLNAGYIVACANAERNKTEQSYKVWKDICKTLEAA